MLSLATSCSVSTSTSKDNELIVDLLPNKAPCNNGILLSNCMQGYIDDTLYTFYEGIQNFNYESGYQYKLLVRKEKLINAPMDHSGEVYILIKNH